MSGYAVGLLLFYFLEFSVGDGNNSFIMKINYTSAGLTRYSLPNIKDGDDADQIDQQDYFLPNIETVERILGTVVDGDCGRDADTLLQEIKKKEKWALQLFDASPKFPVGVLYGQRYQLGNFDECLSAKQPPENTENSKQIEGKYCLADIDLKFPNNDRLARSFMEKKGIYRGDVNSTIYWAICMPSTCTGNDAKDFLESIFTLAIGDASVQIAIDERKCHDGKSAPLSIFEIIYGSILGVFLAFIVIATIFHLVQIRKRKKKLNYLTETGQTSPKIRKSLTYEIIVCFSLIRNLRKMFHVHPNDMNLDCVSGMKVISMFMILAAHGLMFLMSGPVMNSNFFVQESLKVENGFLFNNPLLVDTFLLLSGFLMCFLLLAELEKRNGKINFLVIYIARYIRLTPAYAIVIGFYCTYFIRLGSGPLWDYRISLERDRCLQSWLPNLLYLNNYISTDNLCMFQSWYLAADTHLFMLAPLFIYPLWRWRKVGEFLLGFAIFTTIFISFIFTYVNKLDPTLMVYPQEIADLKYNHYFTTAYIKTHMRATSYFIGLAIGYLIHKIQFQGKKLSSRTVITGWISAAVCGILSMYSIFIFYYPDHEYNVWESSIYSSLHRVGWSLAIGWILFCCITDNAALVNQFLSWKMYFPLSRMTYCAYLLNGIVVLYFYGTLRGPVYLSSFNLVAILLSQVGITFGCAFIFSVLFESPIIALEKVLLKKADKKPQPQDTS